MIDPAERKSHSEASNVSDTTSGDDGSHTVIGRTAEISGARKVCPSCDGQYTDAALTSCPRDGAFLAILDDSQVGTTLENRFELVALLGKGGMGEVYRARDLLMKRDVAVKLLHRHLVSDPQTIRRFQQEAQAASALSHGNVVVAHDFGVSEDGIPYLVLDYLDGRTLAQEIACHSSFDLQRFLHIFAQVCDGLAAAHERGVVHRDIKPGNIMLLNAGSDAEAVRIMDFGIAKIMPHDEDTLQRLTRTGEIFGSPFYMSPEQVQGAKLDARSDVYSLGCVMYETLTGNPPHVGATAFETLTKHLNDPASGIAEARSDIASIKRLEQVVLKTLAKNPAQRYQSVAALKEDLERLLRGEPLREESQLTIAQIRPGILPRSLFFPTILRYGAPVAIVGLIAAVGFLVMSPASHVIAANRFWMVSIGILCYGVTIFVFFLKLFGPAGVLNRIALETYVPHQFQPAQLDVLKKMVSQWHPGGLTLGVFKQYVKGIIPVRRVLTFSADERKRQKHILIVGKAGTGKSTLMGNFMREEIASNRTAVILLDFAGDLTEQLRHHASQDANPERYSFVDLTDPNCQTSLAPQDLMGGFFAQDAIKSAAQAMAFTIGGDASEELPESSLELLRIVLELMFSCGRSIADLPSLLRTPQEMRQLIDDAKSNSTLSDLCDTWQLYDSLLGTDEWLKMTSPIVTRIESMLRDSRLRKLLGGQAGESISLRQSIIERRVLVLKISRDIFMAKTDKLSSAFLFSMVETLRLLSQDVAQPERACCLFMDMIEKTVSPDLLEKLIRKDSRLELFTAAALRSLQDYDQGFRDRLLQQASLLCVFAPNSQDAELLAPVMFRLGLRVMQKSMPNFFANSDSSTPLGLEPMPFT